MKGSADRSRGPIRLNKIKTMRIRPRHILAAVTSNGMAAALILIGSLRGPVATAEDAPGANGAFRIIRVERPSDLGPGSGAEIGPDYYFNGGEADGLKAEMLLDIYRPVSIDDPFSGEQQEVRVFVGQVRIFHLFTHLAVGRIHALAPADQTPVIRYRTVMIGDYAVPSRKPLAQPAHWVVPSAFLFDLNSAALREGAKSILTRVKEIVAEDSRRHLLIEGYTCDLGSASYNRALSLRRARSTADFLLSLDRSLQGRIHTAGHGESRPVGPNAEEAGRRKNRRVEFRILPGPPASTADKPI